MKKFIKIPIISLMVALIAAFSVSPAFAAKGTLLVNGAAKAKVGDKVTYTFYLGDCEEELQGIEVYMYYDSSSLKIDPESVKFPNLPNAVYNAGIEGEIPYNWTSATEFVDFSKTKVLMTADFEVIKEGEADITYFISEMYGEDMTYFKAFTLTESIDINGKNVVKNATPIITANQDYRNQHQGNLVNYADGKGEKNGSGKNHVAETGINDSTIAAPAATEVSQGNTADSNVGTIVIVVAIILVSLAIVIVLIIRRRSEKPAGREQ